jgi:hypothetical protein
MLTGDTHEVHCKKITIKTEGFLCCWSGSALEKIECWKCEGRERLLSSKGIFTLVIIATFFSAKCQQNASKMPANCQQNASKMPAKCSSKMPAKCQQNASKMPTKCQQNVSKGSKCITFLGSLGNAVTKREILSIVALHKDARKIEF